MKKLFKNKKGFTLMEMLIVVAIIVILVAISLPVFSGQLNKAKEAKNNANLRAAKAVGVAEYLTGIKDAGEYWYDADQGILLNSTDSKPIGYAEEVGTNKSGASIKKDFVVAVKIETDGTVTVDWKNSK